MNPVQSCKRRRAPWALLFLAATTVVSPALTAGCSSSNDAGAEGAEAASQTELRMDSTGRRIFGDGAEFRVRAKDEIGAGSAPFLVT